MKKDIPVRMIAVKTKPAVDASKKRLLDDVYHSTSAEEMQIKIASSGKKLDSKDIEWLIETLCYHAAFWPHTLSRWNAFMKLLKIDKDVRNAALEENVIGLCISKVYQTPSNGGFVSIVDKHSGKEGLVEVVQENLKFKTLIPGLQMETYYWSCILTALLKLFLKDKISHDRKFAKKETC